MNERTVGVQWEQIQICPVCSSPKNRVWRCGAHDESRTVDRPLRYLRCKTCGSNYLSPRPTRETIDRLYGQTYAPYESTPAKSALIGHDDPPRSLPEPQRIILRRLWSIYGVPHGQRRVLDFGCGSPAFLDAARARGWVGVGVDVTPEVVQRVQERGHEGRLLNEAFWRSLDQDEFDVVRLNHVIEHIYDPQKDLARLVRSLTAEGTLHLATMNPASLTAALFKRHWLGYDPRHLTLLPPNTLVTMLENAGTQAAEVLHEYVLKDLHRSILLARGRSLDPSSTAMTGGRLLSLFVRLAARIRRADRYHAFARR